MSGQYEPLQPNEKGWLWSNQLELFLGIQGNQLRLVSPQGELLLAPAEQAIVEQQLKELAQQQIDRLAAKLRELGIDPGEIK